MVYAKRAHGLGDNTAMLLGAVGAAGAIAMALVSAFVIDRVGAKPLISLFTAILAVTTVMLAIAPPLGSPTAVWVYLGAVFFFATFGANGATSANSVYYFNLTPSADRLNLGILYFLVTGIPASLGSLGGGLVLDLLASLRVLETTDVYRVYFGATAVSYVGILMLVARLERLGAYRVHDLLGLFASPRDLRALALLHRLKGSSTSDTEQSLVRRLGDAPSRLAAPDLLRRLDSPRFVVRSEALDSLADMPATDELAARPDRRGGGAAVHDRPQGGRPDRAQAACRWGRGAAQQSHLARRVPGRQGDGVAGPARRSVQPRHHRGAVPVHR